MSGSTTISGTDRMPCEFLDRYCRNTGITFAATTLLVLLLTVALWPLVDHSLLLGWSLLLCAVQTGQAWQARRYLQLRAGTSPTAPNRKAGFIAWAVINGLLWSGSFLTFNLPAHDPAGILLLFAIAGVSAYAAVAKAPVLSIALAFEGALLLPLSICLFLQEGSAAPFMGLAALLYLAMLSLLLYQSSVIASQNQSLQARKKEQAAEIGERKCVDQILHFIANPPEGADFMGALAQHVSQSLGMSYVLINHLADEPGMAETVALYARGSVAPNMSYPLADTPCDNVFGKRICCYPRNLQALFPKDALLVDMGAESYAGIPLWDSTGKPIGLIAILDTLPFQDEALILKILQIIAPRAAAELERNESDRQLRKREREFRSLAESAPDNIVRYDREGRLRYLNQRLALQFGLSSVSEILGKRPSELWPDGRFAKLEEAAARVVADGKATELEITEPDGHGNWLHHWISVVPEHGEDGSIIGTIAFGRNITERKRMEQALIERESEFRSLAENSPDAIFRYDDAGRRIYVNHTVERVTGKTREELVGKTVVEAVANPAVDAAQVLQCLTETLQTGERRDHETSFTTPDGERITIHLVLVPEYAADGTVRGALGIGRDITAIRQAEEALRRSEQMMRAVIDATPDWIFIKDREHRYHLANQGYAAALHLAPEDFIGKDDLDLGFPEELVKGNPEKGIRGFWADDSLVMDSNETQVYPDDPATIDGLVHTFHTIKVPLRDCEGKAWGVLAFARDISDRKEMEQTLAEREAFLQTLLDAIAIPVFYKDREGHYLGINRAYEQYFGAARESLVGKSVFDTHPKELAEVYHAKDKEVLERRVDRQEYEFQINHSDGRPRDVLFSKAAFTDTSGSVKGLIGAVMDITERKQAELALLERFNQIVELNDRLSETARQIEEQATELEASQIQLKETEAWYRGILHSAPDGMMVVNERGRIALVNEELERMFGYEPGELAGQPLEILLPADMRSAHVDMRKDYFGDAARPDIPGLDRNLRACRKNGSEFVVDVTLSRLPANDYNAGAICAAVRDVTERRRGEREMAETRNKLRSVLHTIPDLVWLKNTDGIYLACNPAFEGFFGAKEAEIVGKTDHDFVDAKLADFFRQKDMEAIKAGAVRVNEEWITYADDGRQGLLETRKVPVFNAEGKVTGILGVARDITERKRLELEVAKREHEFRTLVENAADTVARYGKDGRRLYANPAFAQLVEGGVDALIGKTPSEAPGGAHAALYEEKLAEVLRLGEETEFELRWHDKSGRELCSLINLTPEFAKDGTVETVLAVGRDISELNAFRQKIHQMAFYDTLTSLPNRALFNDRLRQMIADASWHHQLAGVMMLDMDRFKEVNDTMGHVVGDELLREAGARLNACVRSYDTVARLGGDEFAVLLPDVRHGDDIGRIADKMRMAFERPFLLAGKEMFITCSIGIALYPQDSDKPDDLIRYADSAMYYAKRSGRNAFRFYSRDLTQSANERLMLESELRRALGRGELEMYYQPKVRLSDGVMIGSEALLRWKHPERGLVPPDKFIPIAEDSGLIIDIGEWVLHESCRVASAMNGKGKALHKVAINLSARQFQFGNLLDVVQRALAETACRPEWIELEITESLLLDEDGEVLEVLKAFRALGITVAIDDFGTGYSALSYLARFPITTLKIDRSFVRSIDTDNFRAELVKAILSIAHCLGQEVVAEGVETPGQAAFLTANNCHVAQGYLFSKPVPLAEFKALPASFRLA